MPFGWRLVGDAGGIVDYSIDAAGALEREDTIRSRCLVRLLTRRGSWFADPELGSRLHELQYLKNPRAQMESIAREALQPLIDDGSIAAINVTGFAADEPLGFAQISLEIVEPSGEAQTIGPLALDAGARAGVATPDDPRFVQPERDAAPQLDQDAGLLWGGATWGSTLWGVGGLGSGAGDGWLILPDGNYRISGSGHLVRDATIATRCLIRLKTRRGSWFADPELGSRLHEIAITKDAERAVWDAAQEALQPLIDDGVLEAIDQIEVDTSRPNVVIAHIALRLPSARVINTSVRIAA